MSTVSEFVPSREVTRPPLSKPVVLGIAGLTGVLLLIASRNYGYFFDEAYFVIAGHDHLAWGYFDQPPLVPALAGLAQQLFPGSLMALRFPATLAAAGGVALTGMIARELGGGRAAQGIAATAYALSGAVLVSHWLATYSIDPFFWTLILWLVVRWTRQRESGAADDRLLFAAGAATAFSLEVKFLVPALWVALSAGSLIFGPRDLLRRPQLWLGALFAVAATVPTLLWQAANGWPYTRMSQVVAREFPGLGGYLWDGLAGAGLLIGLPLLLFGLAWLVFSRQGRPYRFIGVAALALVVAIALMSGRSYYLFSLYSPGLAAGAVGLRGFRWPRVVKWLGGLALVVSVLRTLISIPVYPESWAERMPDIPAVTTARTFVEAEVLLPQLAQAVDQTYQELPPGIRGHTAVVTDSYPFAAGVDLLGTMPGIPRAYSGHRGYYYFGAPPEQDTNVLFIGTENPALRAAFTTAQPIVPGFATLYIGRTTSWARLWPEIRTQ